MKINKPRVRLDKLKHAYALNHKTPAVIVGWENEPSNYNPRKAKARAAKKLVLHRVSTRYNRYY